MIMFRPFRGDSSNPEPPVTPTGRTPDAILAAFTAVNPEPPVTPAGRTDFPNIPETAPVVFKIPLIFLSPYALF
jgi:hypothetical protein